MMRLLLPAAILLAVASGAAAQEPTLLQLHELHDSATRVDPRAQQSTLLRRQSALRRANLAAERLPTLTLEGLAQYQSDVARVPLPGGPVPPHDTYDARAGLTQRLIDPTRAARRALDDAQAAQSEAALSTRLYANRQLVNDAFFAALLAQEQEDELRATITALESQLALAVSRVREGAALPSEDAMVRAELLRRRQMLTDAARLRAASLVVLSDLTAVPLDTTARLALPDLAAPVQETRATASLPNRQRPEFAELARSRELLDRQESLRRAQDLPRISAFGRAGYGRPGVNPLNTTFDSYWLGGVQLQWTPWAWGAGRRDREILAVQRQIMATEEDALDHAIRRVLVRELSTVDRLTAALALDEEIIGLRERIAEETRIRYTESAVTAAEAIERQTELLAARITRALHRVELAQARARYLTTLGLETR